MADIIQIRRDTAANWTSANPTLADGEIGYEKDTQKMKIGDGSTAWNSLIYQQASGLTDGIVTYAKVSDELKGSATDNDGTWDFSANGIVIAAFTANTVVSFSNLQKNKTFKAKITVSNSATITLPAYCVTLDGSATASGVDGTYYFYFDCWEDTALSELVLVSIAKAA